MPKPTPRTARDTTSVREEMRREGQWRSVRRCAGTVIFLLVLQVPPRFVAYGVWPSEADIGAWVPVRISLVIDFAMVVAYVLLAYRTLQLVRGVRAQAPPVAFWVGLGAVAVGAALHVVENLVLWFAVDEVTPYGDGLTTAMTPWIGSLVLGGLAVVVLVAILMATATGRRIGQGLAVTGERLAEPIGRKLEGLGDQLQTEGVEPADEKDESGGTIICCSGGGIRSAAFCLGGLQQLARRGVYQRASAVVGVSGGGYMAAAHHVLRWNPGAGDDQEWSLVEGRRPAFATGTPEVHWLRRHTRYLAESLHVATLGALSFLFGTAVNLLWFAALIGGAAWWLAWFLLASGGLRGWNTPDAVGSYASTDWWVVGWIWAVPLGGLAIFTAERVVGRFVTLPHALEERSHRVAVLLLWVGLGLTGILLLAPAALAWVHDWAATSSSALAGLAHQVGFVPTAVCNAELAAQVRAGSGTGACGFAPGDFEGVAAARSATGVAQGVSGVTIATVLAAVLAVVKAAQGSDEEKPDAGVVRRALGFAWQRTRTYLLPWAAVVVLAVAGLLLLLRWTTARLTNPGLLSDWSWVYAGAATLIGLWLLTDANRTSLHSFYRRRLSYAYFVGRAGEEVRSIGYRKALRFSRSRPRDGGPRLVSCAVANVGDHDYVPTGRNCVPFNFDDTHIGLTDPSLPGGPIRTPSVIFEMAADSHARDATIAAAVAISGAAFSPMAGRANGRLRPYRAVLALANARLGVWLPNPLWVDNAQQVRALRARKHPDAEEATRTLPAVLRKEVTTTAPRLVWVRRALAYLRSMVAKPGPFWLMKEAFGKTSMLDSKLYLTDGGHYDNLGLVEALRRRPEEVFVLDASNDPEDTFKALGDAIATARTDLGVELRLDPRPMRRRPKGDAYDRAEMAWAIGEAVYPEEERRPPAKVYLAKVVMIDGLPWDAESYRLTHPEFPRTGTADQLYDEFDFEAYRLLGSEVTGRLLEEREPQGAGSRAEAQAARVESAAPAHVGDPVVAMPNVPAPRTQSTIQASVSLHRHEVLTAFAVLFHALARHLPHNGHSHDRNGPGR